MADGADTPPLPEAPLIACDLAPLPDGTSACFVEAADGARLRLTRFPRPGGPERGTILIVPGWSEFAEKYVEVAADLHARGFGVVVCDPRGQGYSQRYDPAHPDDRRGHVDDFRVFVSDLGACWAHVKRTEPGPCGVLAHSMGGLIVLEWLAEGHGQDAAGAALSAPFTRLYASGFKRAVVAGLLAGGRLLGRGAQPLPGVQEHSWVFEGNVLTQDPARHERFRQIQLTAPEAVAGLPKYDWLNAALRGHARIEAPDALSRLPFPVLIGSATRDETVDHTHHVVLAERYPETIRLVTIEGARHELLMEADEWRDRFLAAFDQYMEERMPWPSSSSREASTAPSSVPRT
jgi:lysophospholipase